MNKLKFSPTFITQIVKANPVSSPAGQRLVHRCFLRFRCKLRKIASLAQAKLNMKKQLIECHKFKKFEVFTFCARCQSILSSDSR